MTTGWNRSSPPPDRRLLFLLQEPSIRLMLLCLLWILPLRLGAAPFDPPGHRPKGPSVHALINATVVAAPGNSIENAKVILRDGLIEAVGRGVEVPGDARIWDLKGATVYAGLIEPYLTDAADSKSSANAAGRAGALTGGTADFFGIGSNKTDEGRRGAGASLGAVHPETRMAGEYSPKESLLKSLRELGFTTANVTPEKGIFRGQSALVVLSDKDPNQTLLRPGVFQHIGFERSSGDRVYPNSLMGVISIVRQTLLDTQHHAINQALYRQAPQTRKRPEFNPSLAALTPAAERKIPVVIEPGTILMADRAGHLARELDLDHILVASGYEWMRPGLAKAAASTYIVPVNFPSLTQLPDEDDWDQISLDELRHWDWAPENPALLRRQGAEIALTTWSLNDRKTFRKQVELAVARGLSEEDALAALTTIPAKLCGVANRLGTIEPGKIANLTVVAGDSYFHSTNKIRQVWIDGEVFEIEPEKDEPEKDADKESDKDKEADRQGSGKEKDGKDSGKDSEKGKDDAQKEKLRRQRTARAHLAGRGVIEAPDRPILVTGATIWTSGPEGRLERADLLIEKGRIKAVGKGLAKKHQLNQNNALVLDAAGKHLTPGLIDAHSHSMILGGVNESTLPSTAMVRIGDVVNSETDNIHQQLAGGLTVANLLHGSANPIGGQNAVIKLRDGEGPEGLKFREAPPGIKFALGENVKQSNWGDQHTTRFPQTRMGVRTFFNNRFTAARQYLDEWDKYKRDGGIPPRRDLELEALGEIVEGRRWIHCHSYRQDEILVFLRTMEEFGVTVGTLQHVLEGYKVADEIARHGAGGSSFSDWWAYKFEVYDAIPYNGTLMHDRGVLVSFNSDSSDHARRMNLEAAKAVKYGGASEEEALAFVTLNPARQLRIDPWVGSLEPGKHGDFVIWSGHPLSTASVCEQTWIEGRKYFDRSLNAERTQALQTERQELLAKAKKVLGTGKKDKPGGGESGDARAAFFHRALETSRDLRGDYSCCNHHQFMILNQ